jgi:serine/threonine protein kinase
MDGSLDATAVVGAASGVSVPSGSRASTPGGNTSRLAVLPRTVATDQGPQLVHREGQARYEAVKALGEGAFGEVELARDHDIDRMVALKRLKPDWLDADSLARFAGEVQIVGQLEHPGIVPVHDVGLDERGYFFVMKFVEGETLERLIERLRSGDPSALAIYSHEARAQLFLQLCQALQYAHNKGLIHRDIKPANVMIGPYGEVMLMDWGLAKRIGTHDARLAPGQSATSARTTPSSAMPSARPCTCPRSRPGANTTAATRGAMSTPSAPCSSSSCRCRATLAPNATCRRSSTR